MKFENFLVDKEYITDMLQSICFYDQDVFESILYKIDKNNEEEVKLVIRYKVLLDYDQRPKQFQTIFKSTLRYYLTYNTSDKEFLEIYNKATPSLEISDKPRNFFLWLWEEIFKKENYHVNDLSKYVVHEIH